MEKDNEYRGQIAALEKRLRAGDEASGSLQRALVETQLDVDARKMEARDLATRAAQLEVDRASSLRKQQEQESEIARLGGIAAGAKQVQEQLAEQHRLGRAAAARYADARASQLRVFGVLLLFALAIAIGYLDKFLIPSLSAEAQRYGNMAVIAVQALMTISGVGLLVNPVVRRPLKKLRDTLFRKRLLELGIPPEVSTGAEPGPHDT